MSQFDFGNLDPYVVDGVQLADDLNLWRNALNSLHRGAARPAYVVPGMLWISDAGGATNWILNVYLSPTVGDRPLFTYDTTTGNITVSAAAGGTLAAAALLAQSNFLPSVRWSATGNGIDQKNWRATIEGSGAPLRFAAYNDAGVETQAIIFGRDGRISTSPAVKPDSWNMTTSSNLIVTAGTSASVFLSAATPAFVTNNGAVITHVPASGAFTIQRDGVYQLNLLGYMELASGAGTLAFQMQLTRGAGTLYDFRQSYPNIFGAGFGISQVVDLLANDVIQIRAANNGAVNGTLYATSGGLLSGGHLQHFSGHRVF